ncbi:MAG: hypothetical protein MUP45_01885 [Candidatus Marinimicrobia bacterium]|nr:hypothetical protein [Candidatus Neomarinimicrobiota bacterium]
MAEGSQVVNGKTLLYRAYVGSVTLSKELEGSVHYHQGMGVVIANIAGMTVYDHRDSSIEAIITRELRDVDWENVRLALDKPAFIQVKRKDGGQPYLVLLPISRKDKEEKSEAKNPHFLLSLLRFPDGGPLTINYPGAFWQRPYMAPNCWDAELIAITTGFVPNGASHPQSRPSLPRKVMIFQVNGQEGWYVLGSRVNRLSELDNELHQLIEETS